MDKERLNDDELFDLLVKTIKQVLASRPQVLFRAFKKVGSDSFFDRMKAELDNKPKLAQSILARGAICMAAWSVLLNSGLAHLESDDFSDMAFYAQFVSQETTRK
jgi:hypothetical protein